MTIKSHKKGSRRTPWIPGTPKPGAESQAAYKPKAGPGQTIKREMIAEVGGGHAMVKRYKNIDASPLMAAYDREQLHGPGQATAEERRDYGTKFAKWHYERVCSPSRDSTQQGVGGSAGSRSITEVQQLADRQIAHLREKMFTPNFLIVEAFCGDGYSMIDSLRRAGVEAHPVGTAYRVREALDELVCILTGRIRVPFIVP